MKETDKTTLPIVDLAKQNDQFRKVVMTGEKMQVVLMAIPAGGDIGAETHAGHDQILSFVASGAHHNFINDGAGPLKLYTMYGPPEHAPGTEHGTKAEADADEH